jgi:methanogenic corrinoid protein MtbC1
VTDVLDAEVEAYWDAVSAGDGDAAYAVASASHGRGAALGDVLRALVTGSQARVGTLWAANEWTVGREHAATAVSESVVRRLGGAVEPPADGPVLLVACAEREWHALPALVVTHSLRAMGYRAEFLGANCSRDQMVARILDAGPRLVLLSASVASSLPRVRRQIEAVRGTGTPVVVGGHAFAGDPQRAQRLGATAYAATPDDVARMIHTLPLQVPNAGALRGPTATEARAIQAAADEVARDVLAHPDLLVLLGDGGPSPDDWTTVLATFVPHVVDCVVGALLAEDPAVLPQERAWLTEVVARRGGEPGAVDVLWSVLAARLQDFPRATGMLLG